MNNLIIKFRDIFMSERNIKFLLQQAKLSHQDTLDINGFTEKYTPILIDIQSQIFDLYYNQLTQQLPPDTQLSNINFETILMGLNNSTLSEFQRILAADTHQLLITAAGDHTSESNSSVTRTECVHYHHIFSNDCSFNSGRYTFPFQISSLKSISLQTIHVNCNLYNITELNNKFELLELFQGEQLPLQITVPIGYYTLEQLVETIGNLINDNSPNHLHYIFSRHPNKNKLYFKSDHIFSLHFLQNDHLSLSHILGFKQQTYMNNNMYVAENTPMHDIHDNLFFRLYLNDKEIAKVTSTTPHFTYFSHCNINLDHNFGNNNLIIDKRECDLANELPFEIDNEIDIQDITIEIWNSPSIQLVRKLDFSIMFAFEY
jgi:hypothetical protein